MILDRNEVFYLTQLQGYRIVNHQLRKRLLIDLMLRHFPAGAMLADIGCAAGDLSMELQALGYRVTGIDFERGSAGAAGTVASEAGGAMVWKPFVSCSEKNAPASSGRGGK